MNTPLENFLRRQATANVTIENARKALNLQTSAELRVLRTVDLKEFSEIMGYPEHLLVRLEEATNSWMECDVKRYLTAVKQQSPSTHSDNPQTNS